MENIFEISVNPEQSEKVLKVVLHFFRHGEPERDPNKTNAEYELTESGRKQAIEKSKAIGGKRNLNQSAAIASPRKRTQETSAFAMTGGYLDTITGTESLEELKEKIHTGKIRVNPQLDFYLDKDTPFGHKAFEAIFTNKDYLRFLVEESDNLAKEEHDFNASTYSRQASNIAKIVKKHASVASRLSTSIKNNENKDLNFERFLGTHGGVVESFLLKVIEKVKGVEERNRLLDFMPNQFDYTEGIDITLANEGSNQTMHILFKKEDKKNREKNFVFDEDIPLTVIDDIIKEGDTSS